MDTTATDRKGRGCNVPAAVARALTLEWKEVQGYVSRWGLPQSGSALEIKLQNGD
jgi:hypothetical protein